MPSTFSASGIAWLLALVALLAPLPAARAAEVEVACTAGGCHAGPAAATLHPAGAACESCHRQRGKGHPQEEAAGFELVEGGGCRECHPEIGRAAHPHRPVTEGCLSCHTGHRSAATGLLRRGYPATMYAGYTDSAYGLCFGCHRRELLRFPDTSFATGFRHGEQNLHFLHVNRRKRGVSCRLCHAMHDSSGPRLIAETVAYGRWQMPLNFTSEADGGSCAPGCHLPARYDRKAAPAPKPAVNKEEGP